MVRFAIGFAVVALVLAVLGFGGLVGVAVGIVRYCSGLRPSSR